MAVLLASFALQMFVAEEWQDVDFGVVDLFEKVHLDDFPIGG